MKRAHLLLAVVLLAGCEQQEAVPLSKSVPVAVLQLVALVGPVFGGHWLLERAARRRSAPPEGEVGPLRLVGAAVFGLAALAIVGILAWWIMAIPSAYSQETVSVFSWEDSVALLWLLLVPGALLAVFELRLAAACRRGRAWAGWGAGVQFAAVALVVLTSFAPSG